MTVAFLSFKVSKSSGEEFSKTPVHIGTSGTCLWASPIRNTVYHPCSFSPNIKEIRYQGKISGKQSWGIRQNIFIFSMMP